MANRSNASGAASGSNAPEEWFAASVVLYFEFEVKGAMRTYAWENVYVVRTRGAKLAARRATALAKAECYPSVRMIKFRNRWAKIRFGGVRKVTYCMPPATVSPEHDAVLTDGTEVTHSVFRVNNKAGLRALIAGRPVNLRYEE